MPANTKIRDALTIPGTDINAAMLEAIEERYAYVIKAGETLSEVIPGFTHSVIYNGVVFTRDDADSTTPSDGTFCVVLNGGVRYKSASIGGGPAVRRFAVISILSTPPTSPVVGAAYIAGTGSIGLWAAKDGQIPIWTLAGWRFVVPKAYDEAHVSALNQVYHYNASSVWVSGVAAFSFIDNSVSFSKLKHGLGQAVESTSLNTPPPSPSEGVAYIGGSSPTGAWTGWAFRLIIYENGVWVSYAPQQGWVVMNKQNGNQLIYTATGWESAVSGYSKIASSGSLAGGSSTGGYAFSGTAPSTSNTAHLGTFNYMAKKAGATLEITIVSSQSVVNFSGADSQNIALGIFIDSTANAVAWCAGPLFFSTGAGVTLPQSFTYTFEAVAPDTLSHSYSLRGSTVTHGSAVYGINIIIRERA